MTNYRFVIGQMVRLKALPRDEPVQAFSVVRLMPLDEAGVPQYRVKGVATGQERFVREVDIETSEMPPAGGGRH